MQVAVIISSIAILLAIPTSLLLVSLSRELSALRGRCEAFENKETRHYKELDRRLEKLEKLDDVKHKRIGRLEDAIKPKAEARKPKARPALEEDTTETNE